MLNWLRQKFATTSHEWQRLPQPPQKPFPFPQGARLKPEEDVIIALPSAVVRENETIGSVILCDDAAKLSLNDELEVWYVHRKRLTNPI